MNTLSHNKVCELEDFSNPDIKAIIRDVYKHQIKKQTGLFPSGEEYRKHWEIAMSVRALNDFGAINKQSRILGVGAGTELLLYYLTNLIEQVFATDLYMMPSSWDKDAPRSMLFSPEKFCPYDYDHQRLVVQHMDARILNYPDGFFDGVFSSSSIEHFGDLRFISNAAYEMGRVIKPGGILTLSTEYLISDVNRDHSYQNLQLFTKEEVLHSIVEASGLELVDEVSWQVSKATMDTKTALSLFLNDSASSANAARSDDILWSKYPHIVLQLDDNLFTSINLTLRKNLRNYLSLDNSWAKPDQLTNLSVQNLKNKINDRPSIRTYFLEIKKLLLRIKKILKKHLIR